MKVAYTGILSKSLVMFVSYKWEQFPFYLFLCVFCVCAIQVRKFSHLKLLSMYSVHTSSHLTIKLIIISPSHISPSQLSPAHISNKFSRKLWKKIFQPQSFFLGHKIEKGLKVVIIAIKSRGLLFGILFFLIRVRTLHCEVFDIQYLKDPNICM